MPNKRKEGTSAVTFTLENDLLLRAAFMAEQLERDHPGLRFTRFDAIRATLTKHLPATPAGWAPHRKDSPAIDGASLPSGTAPAKPSAKKRSATKRAKPHT